MNYENLTDKEAGRFQYIQTQLQGHWEESKMYFSTDNIVGLFLQGSQNYDLDTPSSDVDTKLVVTPSLSDIIMNRDAVSTTHIRTNDEHIDFKDIRLMLQTFRKQNINFIEILFTDYYIINSIYVEPWKMLRDNAEDIAHYNIYSTIKAMKGVALEKYFALEHKYPSKIEIIKQYGYDPKQLHHLLRIQYFLEDYLKGMPYKECLKSRNKEYLISIKNGCIKDLNEARLLADKTIDNINMLTEPFTKDSEYNVSNKRVEEILNTCQEMIMTISIKNELIKKETGSVERR